MEVPETHLHALSPKSFWRDYVAPRHAVVIHGVPENFTDNFTDDVLLDKAGADTVVVVEHRSGSADTYGQGHKVPMTLRDFITRMQQGDSKLYLSTQEVGVGHDGHPLLYSAPLVGMEGSFPLEQPLLKHLAPQSINMWMGCAPEGSSSGLHHDFHDNLYILLRGSKRFRLFPPSTAPDMYLRGCVRTIYPNGRIVYEGSGDIQADGSSLHDVRLWNAHNAADQAAATAAAAASAAEVDEAEALLEQQLEQMLEEGAAHDDGSLMDDYVDSDSDALGSDDSEDRPTRNSNSRHKQQLQQQQQQQRLAKQASHHQQQKGAQAARAAPQVSEPPPPSFSQVDLSLPEAELRQHFPRFPGLSAALTVVLQAGDMLFLPAGWFHEVTSYGGPGLDGGHLALNYWYHPPDNLDPGRAGFSKPYTSPFYPTIWANRRGWVQAETHKWWQQQQQHLRQQLRMKQPQQQQQPQQPRQPKQQEKQQQQQGQQCGTALGKRRRIQWAATVGDPGNVYAAFNTRPGTATGSCTIKPKHSGRSTYMHNCPSFRLREISDDDGTSSSSDEDEPTSVDTPDDEQQHRQLGQDVAQGIDALEAYFSDNPDAMKQLLGQFLAERRARLAAASRASSEQQNIRLPWLRGRRHHYTVSVKLTKRRPKPKPHRL